jgi:predicted signal transduction protein with EAL and GGDEF domain
VSIGVASAGPAELGATGLIERADHALYEAKRAGRDRYSVAGDAATPVPASGSQKVALSVVGSRRP